MNGRQKYVLDLLENVESRIKFTSDIWTSSQNIAYIVLTAHFVNKA